MRGVLLAVLLAPACTALLQAQQVNGPRVRVGVIPLGGTAYSAMTQSMGQQQPMPSGGMQGSSQTSTTIQIPPPSDFSRGLTEMLTTSLVQAGRFTVLERAQLEKVLGEQRFGQSGAVTAQSAAEAGRMLGAQVLVFGDVTEYAYSGTTTGGKASIIGSVAQEAMGSMMDQTVGSVVPKAVNASVRRMTAKVGIDLRLVDATTGQVLQSVRGRGSASATGVAADFQKAEQQIAAGIEVQTPLGRASRGAIDDAVKQMAARLASVPWSGVIADVRGAQIYVNAGSEAGVSPGLELDVFSPEGGVVDPSTGELLGANDEKSGSIRIVKVNPRFSIATAVAGGTFRRNDIVRLPTPEPP
jgi:curli biogenesis system outer membrane secretion channel CsgG